MLMSMSQAFERVAYQENASPTSKEVLLAVSLSLRLSSSKFKYLLINDDLLILSNILCVKNSSVVVMYDLPCFSAVKKLLISY